MSTLLIADDSQTKIDLMRSMLTHFEWNEEVLIANTSEEASDLIEVHTITHAFVDYYIPSKNGPSIIAALKAKNPHAHITLVSSGDNPENQQEAIQAGAETCICTTYEADIVENAFKEIVHNWKN
jgi:DNA-binding NarL/FixJ family response regulator